MSDRRPAPRVSTYNRAAPPESRMQVEARRVADAMETTRVALSTAPPATGGRPQQRPVLPTQQELLEGARNLWREDTDRGQGVAQMVARALLVTPFYPARFVQRLIQLGYEPVAPRRIFSFLFQQHLYYYPGLFGYMQAVARDEGWRGLFRGVGSLVVADVVELTAMNLFHPVIQSAVHAIPLPFSISESGDVPDTDPNYKHSLPSILTRGTRRFILSLASKTLVELVVHPFHVISVRTIAQLIGKETLYGGVWRSFKEIYRTEGLGGFYAGLAPALLGHLCMSVIHSSLWLFFEIIIANISSDIVKVVMWSLVAMPIIGYIPGTYSYPFFLMSNMMAVNGAPLAAARPPRVPIFNSWLDCYSHLKSTGSLYRGSAILFSRYAYKDLQSLKN